MNAYLTNTAYDYSQMPIGRKHALKRKRSSSSDVIPVSKEIWCFFRSHHKYSKISAMSKIASGRRTQAPITPSCLSPTEKQDCDHHQWKEMKVKWMNRSLQGWPTKLSRLLRVMYLRLHQSPELRPSQMARTWLPLTAQVWLQKKRPGRRSNRPQASSKKRDRSLIQLLKL